MRIGVLGGSFDPIHIGHMLIAQEAHWQCELDTVLFMVSARPPHKREPEATAEDRFRMVEIAISNDPCFRSSRMEIERGGNSYTEDTLKELRRLYPEASLHLIGGADSALDFSNWRHPDAVIEMADFIIAPRPDFDLSRMEPGLRERTRVLEGPIVRISSTMIRKRLHEGKSVRFLVPETVEKYIRERGLYAD